MASTQTAYLFALVKSMSKAEKRSFKLYATRIQGAEPPLFVQLFDALDRQKSYDEAALLKRVPKIKRRQLSNLKAHLYRQLLTSLRLVSTEAHADIDIREQIDFAKVLYQRGLFRQSLKLLDKTKARAAAIHHDFLHLQIVEFEKLIESRHVTGSAPDRATQLAEESYRRGRVARQRVQLSNLALKLYGMYIRIGHVRDARNALLVKEYFAANLPAVDVADLEFYGRLFYYQSHVLLYYILQDFARHYRYSVKWVGLFEATPAMQRSDPDTYLRGLHNLLNGLFFIGYHSRFEGVLAQLEAFVAVERAHFDTNTRVLAFLHLYTARMDRHFLTGTFSEGLALIPELTENLPAYAPYLDQQRVSVFYYKIACLYFGSGDSDTALDWLNKIIQLPTGAQREDIQCYARLLHLIAHYELGHYFLLEYLVKSVYRFLKKMKELNAVQEEILRFLRRELYSDPKSLRRAFRQLRTTFVELETQPYERRAFLYLDFIAWLESKIDERPIQEVIRDKYLARRR